MTIVNLFCQLTFASSFLFISEGMPMNEKHPKKREPQDFPALGKIPDMQAIANLAEFCLEGSFVASQEKLSYAGSSISDISSNFNIYDSEALNMSSTRDRERRKLRSEGPAGPSPGIDSEIKKKRPPRPKTNLNLHLLLQL
jgi:hypothetical protein